MPFGLQGSSPVPMRVLNDAMTTGLHGPAFDGPVKATKCAFGPGFGRAELGFLGHRVSAAGVAVDPRKVAAVRDWPAPPSNVELRRFV